MTYSNDWDETIPIDHTKFSQQPGHVRSFKTDVAERISAFIYGFVSGETDTAIKRLDFKSQGSDPSAPAATVISLYAKTVSGAAEFYLRHTTAGVIQLTSLGKFLIGALTVASAAAGDIIYHNGTSFVRLALGTALQYLRTNSGATAPEWATMPHQAGILGSFRNLRITRPSATQVTITADELCLEDSSNNKFTIRSVNETAAITASGADGLDTGAEGSSRWYYIWIIRKSSDGTVASLLSESSSSPTMPSGYDQKALVSAVYNDSSSDFVNFIQSALRYYYPANQVMYDGTPGATWVSVDTTAFIPSALSDYGRFILAGASSTGAQMSNDSSVSAAYNTNAPNKVLQCAVAGTAPQDCVDMMILTANTVYAADTSAMKIYCAGFDITKFN